MRRPFATGALVVAAVVLAACGGGGEPDRQAYCAGLAFDYPAMLDHLAVGADDADAAAAATAFLAEFYTDAFAAGAPDKRDGLLVVEGAQAALAGDLEPGRADRYQAAFRRLDADSAEDCP